GNLDPERSLLDFHLRRPGHVPGSARAHSHLTWIDRHSRSISCAPERHLAVTNDLPGNGLFDLNAQKAQSLLYGARPSGRFFPHHVGHRRLARFLEQRPSAREFPLRLTTISEVQEGAGRRIEPLALFEFLTGFGCLPRAPKLNALSEQYLSGRSASALGEGVAHEREHKERTSKAQSPSEKPSPFCGPRRTELQPGRRT